MNCILSLSWFFMVGVTTIAYVLVGWALRRVRYAASRPYRNTRRVITDIAAGLLGQATIMLIILMTTGPSSGLYGFFAAYGLGFAIDEVILAHRSAREREIEAQAPRP